MSGRRPVRDDDRTPSGAAGGRRSAARPNDRQADAAAASDPAPGGPARQRRAASSGRHAPGTDRDRDDGTDRQGPAGWRPVDGPDERGTSDTAAASDPAWAQERLVQEFMQRPEGRVEEGAVVIRPSLWAALERGLVAFAGISVFVLPLVIAALFGVGDPSPDEPRFVVFFEVVQGLIVPLLFSFVPVVQLAFTRYIIDEEGIRERVQLVSRTDKRVRWEKVTALQHRITLLDRLFGIQRINVIAYGARGTTIRLVGLRRAPRLRRLVAKQMRVNASFDRLLTND